MQQDEQGGMVLGYIVAHEPVTQAQIAEGIGLGTAEVAEVLALLQRGDGEGPIAVAGHNHDHELLYAAKRP